MIRSSRTSRNWLRSALNILSLSRQSARNTAGLRRHSSSAVAGRAGQIDAEENQGSQRLDEAAFFAPSTNIISSSRTASTASQNPQGQWTNMSELGCMLHDKIWSLCRTTPGIAKALSLISQFQESGFPLTASQFHPILRELGRVRMTAEAFALFEAMKKAGIQPTATTYGNLIYSCTAVRWLHQALSLLEEVKRQGLKPNSLCYNPIILDLTKQARLTEAVTLLQEMASQGILADKYTYVQLIHGCAVTRSKDMGLKVLAMMREQGVEQSDSLHSVVIELLSKTSTLSEVANYVSDVVGTGQELKVKALGALVSAFASAGKVDDALEIYNKARDQGAAVYPYAITSILLQLARQGRLDQMCELYFANMDPHGWPDLALHSCIQSLCSAGLHCAITCMQHKDFDRAMIIAQRMLQQNLISSRLLPDAILLGMVRGLKGSSLNLGGGLVRTLGVQDGIEMIEKMKGFGWKPSRTGMEVLLDLCGEMGDLEKAKTVMGYLEEEGLPPTAFTLFRMFRVAVTVEDEESAIQALNQMSAYDLGDRHVQMLVEKTLEPHEDHAKLPGMESASETLPAVRKRARELVKRATET